MDLAAKGLGAKEWNNSLKTKLSLLPKKLFRIRMSRNLVFSEDRKSGSAGMPRPISYAVFCLKKKRHVTPRGRYTSLRAPPTVSSRPQPNLSHDESPHRV